ncbi:MAG: hypothetical protein SFU56_11720 [Capsulimonadales bacterium]|nr:hypothetical protein [Capsulimonadales bacterium]
MAELSVTDTPVTRSLVSGTCVLITVWSVFICVRIQMMATDRGEGAAYWAKRGPISMAQRVKEIEDNPRMPPQAKRMAIAQIMAHMGGKRSNP